VISVRNDKIRHATALFSNSFFKRIVLERDIASIKRYADKYIDRNSTTNPTFTFQDIIHTTYSCFEKNYRFEYLYKNKLINQILLEKYKAKNTVVFTELSVAKSIADLVLINGSAVLYEIKTELDKTSRLESQIANYYKCFNAINIVTHESLYLQYLKLSKVYGTGLLIYNSSHELETARKARKDSSRLDHLELFKLLRKSEVLSILGKQQIPFQEVPNTKFFQYFLELSKNIEITVFHQLVFQELKKRKLEYTLNLLSKEIPIEIKLIFNCLNFSPSDTLFLLNLLKKKISA
jgi:hypothetical protein